MKLLLILTDKTQAIVDVNDIVAICPAMDSNIPYIVHAIMEVHTSTKTLQCTDITFGYGQAIAGKSVNETKQWQQELYEEARKGNQ